MCLLLCIIVMDVANSTYISFSLYKAFYELNSIGIVVIVITICILTSSAQCCYSLNVNAITIIRHCHVCRLIHRILPATAIWPLVDYNLYRVVVVNTG